MKKKIILSLAFLFSVLALAACSKTAASNTEATAKGDTTTANSGNSYGNLEDGLVTNYVEPKTYVATREDQRVKAYTAYTSEGAEIGQYTTIAAAINAAVDNDVEEEVFGSYVTKTGYTQKLFYNKEGYTSDNDDQFWFYENGNALDSYNCWDSASHINSLRNTNYIVHEVSSFGTVSEQSWNSYGLLDSYGEEENSVSAQSWELSSTMDAAVIEFTARRGGITKFEYNIDLSNVKITPPYSGSDKTYAFIGFYSWQDYYVIALGIACDTSTGNWYQFIGTSRDDSFSDVTYDTGKCIMTSTWNEAGGYFVPDASSLTATIETILNYDEEFDEYYQTDVATWALSNGTTYTRTITDSLVNNYFAGQALSMENSYVFIAGLDIKNSTTVGNYVENTDYFNGSAFENLTITSARCYVPTEEELDDVDYGYAINEEWRGKWHDLLLANNEDTDAIYDYVVLNTNVCADYTAINNQDVFSFSYNGEANTSTGISTNLTKYQAQINKLSVVTKDNALLYNDEITAVGAWLVENANIVPTKYLNALDFTVYYQALELLNSISLSEEGEKVAAEMKVLTVSDYETFKTIYDSEYAALSDDDKVAVRISCGANTFDQILNYANFMAGLNAETTPNVDLYKAYVFLYAEGSSYVKADTKESLNVVEAAKELTRLVDLLVTGTQWTGDYSGYNDDPNNDKSTLMNGDNNFYPSLKIVMLVEYFEANNITLSDYITGRLTTIGYDSFYDEFYYPLYMVTEIALKVEAGTVKAIADLTDEEFAFLNNCWTSGYTIGGQISWNWESGQQFMTYYNGRSAAISYLAGADGTKAFKTYAEELNTFLSGLGYSANSNGWGVTASSISK